MGLMTSNYIVKDFGIEIETAYAIISDVLVSSDGIAHATFNIQQNREAAQDSAALERKHFSCKVNKSLPIYEQIYIAAKDAIFNEWIDDIPAEEMEQDIFADESKETV